MCVPAIDAEWIERGFAHAAVRIGDKRGYLDLARNRFLDETEFLRRLESEQTAALAARLEHSRP